MPDTPPTTIDPFGPLKAQLEEMATDAFDQYARVVVGLGTAVLALAITLWAVKLVVMNVRNGGDQSLFETWRDRSGGGQEYRDSSGRWREAD